MRGMVVSAFAVLLQCSCGPGLECVQPQAEANVADAAPSSMCEGAAEPSKYNEDPAVIPSGRSISTVVLQSVQSAVRLLFGDCATEAPVSDGGASLYGEPCSESMCRNHMEMTASMPAGQTPDGELTEMRLAVRPVSSVCVVPGNDSLVQTDALEVVMEFVDASGEPGEVLAFNSEAVGVTIDYDSREFAVTGSALVTRVLGASGQHLDGIEMDLAGEIADTPPIADAGEDIIVDCEDAQGAHVELDGSGSLDAEGNVDQFLWWRGEAPAVWPRFEPYDETAYGPVGAEYEVVADTAQAEVLVPGGRHEFTLTVSGGIGIGSSDRVIVEVRGACEL